MNKAERHKIIIELISKREIDTQEELVSELKTYDHSVTQATVSRDTKELGLVKIKGNIKRFKYAYVAQSYSQGSKQLDLFKKCVVSVNASQNLIVIKTIVGSANAACIALDAFNIPNVLGTIAGDDTILIIVNGLDAVPEVVTFLENLTK